MERLNLVSIEGGAEAAEASRGGGVRTRRGGASRGGGVRTSGGGASRGGGVRTRRGGASRGGGVRTRGGGASRGGGVRTRGGGATRGGGVRTRGGGASRGGVVRTRGGGASRDRGSARPRAFEELNLVSIKSLPVGRRSARALTRKRKRCASPATVSTKSPVPPPSPSPHGTPASVGFPPSSEIYVDNGPSGSATPVLPPVASLALRQPSAPAQRLWDEEIDFNFGSDPESDDEDDVFDPEECELVVPRTTRTYQETPDDVDGGLSEDVGLDEDLMDDVVHETPLSPEFYDFVWRAFPVPPISPNLRKETFDESNVGPTTPSADPYDTFTAIWDRQIMEHIVSETNVYAQEVVSHLMDNNQLGPHSRITRWVETTVDELYVFFAIILAMGVVCLATIEEYWNSTPDIFYTPGFRAHMSLRRFQLLCKCIHFNRNENMRALNLDVWEAKLFKIKPVVDHLNSKFESLYSMSRGISLDESLLLWKGWLNINQIIPNKAAVVGIKTYELCESQTGYLWRFVIHAGHRSQQSDDPMDTFTSATVLKLVHGLEHRGHTLWMDNYYNSPALARKLKSLGFDCVGTLRTNRQFVPEELTSLTKDRMRQGEIAGFTSGDVDVMVWRDKNRVAMISTYHGNEVAVKGTSTKPVLILDYNVMMGGVDKKDQLLAQYPIERKRTRVWYKKLFRRLLNVSVLNSYVMCKHSEPSLEHRPFRRTLIKALLERHCVEVAPVNIPMARRPFIDARDHRPDFYPIQAGGRLRRTCVVCKGRVSTFCVGCAKTACIPSCFAALHS